MTVLFGRSDTIGRALSRLAEKVLLKAEICTLYGKAKATISEHISNVLQFATDDG